MRRAGRPTRHGRPELRHGGAAAPAPTSWPPTGRAEARHDIAYWGARGLTSLPLNGTPGPADVPPQVGEKGIPAPASSTSRLQASGR
jgi:hypothetical protein